MSQKNQGLKNRLQKLQQKLDEIHILKVHLLLDEREALLSFIDDVELHEDEIQTAKVFYTLPVLEEIDD